MDSIFFNNNNNEPPSGSQQQQRRELTEKLLLNNTTNTTTTITNDEYNNYNNNNNNNSSYPPSQQYQEYEHGTEGHHLFPPVTSSGTNNNNSNNSGGGMSPPQLPQYRDVWAAIVFIVLQGLMVYYALYGIHNLWYDHHHYRDHNNNDNDNDSDDTLTMRGLTYMILLSTLTALAVTCAMIVLLMKYAHMFLQMTLIMIVMGNVLTVLFCLQHSYWFGTIGAILFLLYALICARSYQRRLPYAAANLNVALTAITTNHGLLFIAFAISIIINFLYSVICILAYFGSYSKHEIDTNTDDIVPTHRWMMVFLVAVYYWTTEVGKNVIHVTTAGVMGTFWFTPDEASTFWSPAIYDSFYRSITYSFGSICFGSLVTTILHVLHQWIRDARAMHRRTSLGPSVILCALECMSTFLERIITYFNKWSYVYIGLYGYDYLTAGHKVMTLFVERGWTTIMNDQLVTSVLTLVSTMIGIGAGCVGLLLSLAHPAWVSGFGEAALVVAFCVPAMIGVAMALILTSVIVAAVDTVVVAFAEAPMELERNHPGLSAQMVTAWRHVYPDEFGR